jgi:hypothetical protein
MRLRGRRQPFAPIRWSGLLAGFNWRKIMESLKEFIKKDMPDIIKVAKTHRDEVGENFADDRLLFFAEMAMKEKLNVSRRKGKGGWWNKDDCSVDHLKNLLLEHIEKGDMVDVMNFAAMIYVRECADS